MASRLMLKLTAALMLMAATAQAETYTFQQGVTDAAHPELGVYEAAHDLVIATTTWPASHPDRLRMKYFSGSEQMNTLIRFEGIDVLPGMLEGAQVTFASITLTWQYENVFWNAATIDVYEALKPWADPNATWADANTGAQLAWETSGAQGPTDRGELISSTDMGPRTFSPSVQYQDEQQFVFPLSATLVQSWIDDPGSNLGLIMTMNNLTASDVTFSSSEDTEDLNFRPLLTIEMCPTLASDLNLDYYVDMRDFGILESGWVETYGLEDLALMAQEWLLCSDPDNPSQCIETCATE